MTKTYVLVCSNCGANKWKHYRDERGRNYKVCSAWWGCTCRRGKYVEFDEWIKWMQENYGNGEWPC